MPSSRGLVCVLLFAQTGCTLIIGNPQAGDHSGKDMGRPCVAGASCATGFPGLCNAGHVTCGADGAACTPDVTAQPCYSGPAGTSGQGTCHGGSQSCVGALGAC